MGLDGKVAAEHYWWLAADWTNLLPTCVDCHRAKGNRFPVGGARAKPMTVGKELRKEQPMLLDPCLDRPERHLLFTEDGVVQSNTPRGRTTIEIVGLNRRGLVSRRRDSYMQLAAHLRFCEQLLVLLEESSEDEVVHPQVEDELQVGLAGWPLQSQPMA